jgi:myo-inositol-1(or 4)-monophosphatase
MDTFDADTPRARPDSAGSEAHGTALVRAAEEAARAAGRVLAEREPGPARVTGLGAHDVKLDIDVLCERAITAVIRERFPGDSILSEEAGLAPGDGPRTWVVDPLDGTVNFWHGLPLYCVSVACLSCRPERLDEGWADALEAAAVLVPALGEMYLAGRDAGATLNGRPLALPSEGSLEHALVCVGIRARDGDLPYSLRMVATFAAEAQKVRSLGFAAGELAFLAAGRIDALVLRGTNLWDFCAGALLVREAGGILTAVPAPAHGWQVAASHAGIHDGVAALAGSP